MNAEISTLVTKRTVRPGKEAVYRGWVSKNQSTWIWHSEHMHTVVFSKEHQGATTVDFVHVFADKASLDAWLRSESNVRLNAEADDFSDFDGHELLTAASRGAGNLASPVAHAPKWKMAGATFLAVYPFTALIIPLQEKWIPASWPFLVNNAILNLVLAITMTYVLMPAVSRFLKQWLH